MNVLDAWIRHTLKWEGGLNTDPGEPGGASNRGVSWELYQKKARDLLGHAPAQEKFMNISTSDAAKFMSYIWNTSGAWRLPDPVNGLLAEYSWLSGSSLAGKALQRILNAKFGQRLTIDGAVGSLTEAAVRQVNPQKLAAAMVEDRARFLDDLVQRRADKMKWRKGWANRENALLNLLNIQLSTAGGSIAWVALGVAAFLIMKGGKNG
ncbi:MAG: putative peptidoglycan-binding domain-containing protein [Bacteroidota bacterium]